LIYEYVRYFDVSIYSTRKITLVQSLIFVEEAVQCMEQVQRPLRVTIIGKNVQCIKQKSWFKLPKIN
jgi:hypothetical protein